MVYVFGVIGLVFGFVAGQMLLYVLLRHKSTDDLLNDKSLKLKYGLLCWGLAVAGCYAFIVLYKMYFDPLS